MCGFFAFPLLTAWLLSSADAGGDDDNDDDDNDDDDDKEGDGAPEEELAATAKDADGDRGDRRVVGPSSGGRSLSSGARDVAVDSGGGEREGRGRSRSESVASQATQTTVESLPSSSDRKGGGGGGGGFQQRYLEILVHNVSHTDLVLSLGCSAFLPPADEAEPPYALCRPRFSAFDLFTRRVLDVLNGPEGAREELKNSVISFPRYERSDATPRYSLVTPRTGRKDMLPAGFDLDRLGGGPVRGAADAAAAGPDDVDAADGVLVDGPDDVRGGDATTDAVPTLGRQCCRVSPSELPSLRLRGRDVSRMGGLYDRAMHGHWEAVASSSSSPSPSSAIPSGAEGEGVDAREREEGGRRAGRRASAEDLVHHSSSFLDVGTSLSGGGGGGGGADADADSEAGPPGADEAAADDLRLNAVFFPLLSTLMRRWHETISDKFSSSSQSSQPQSQQQQQQSNVKKVVILVTGVGTPRNWTHSIAGNSTEACAELMESFIEALYPDVTVVRIHSKTNIFRYDENISLAKRELMPCVDAYRDAHARGEPYPDEIFGGGRWASPPPSGTTAPGTLLDVHRGPFDPDWKGTLSVALSFADGSPARTHAIQASLRPYRPAYFHFWQLKTFWHDTKMCDDDVEAHSFEDMETVPAMEVDRTAPEVRMVVAEMRRFRERFLARANGADGAGNDIRNFWLRKTRKPVLAVLLVRDPRTGGLVTYRGANMEVSMPTGSLCAERNVIGTALASDPGLKREDLRMVAVLAVPLPPPPSGEGEEERRGSLSGGPAAAADATACAEVEAASAAAGNKFPSEVLTEVGKKLSEQQQQQQARSKGMPRTLSVGSFASIAEDASAEEEERGGGGIAASWVVEKGMPPPAKVASEEPPLARESATVAAADVPPLRLRDVPPSPPGTPVRKVRLHRTSFQTTFGGSSRKKKRTVVVHSSEDINPLRPCGACNEWLKKIAESNPYFRVVTFTDADCNGVYVTPCQD